MVTFVDQKKKPRAQSDVREIRRSERSLQIRAETANSDEMTIEAVLSTEQPVRMFDWREYKVMDEVLLSSGRTNDATIPMLDSHRRWSLDDVFGHMKDIRTEGANTVVTCCFDKDDDNATRAFRKYKNGHCRALSVGYTVMKYVDIGPGQSATVAGRKWTASPDRKMRICTEWRADEGSLVVLGADSKAKTRGARDIDGLSSEVSDEDVEYLMKREERRQKRSERSITDAEPIQGEALVATLQSATPTPTVVVNVNNGDARSQESNTAPTGATPEVSTLDTVNQSVPADAGGDQERTGTMSTTVTADSSAAPDVEKIRTEARQEGIRLERERQEAIREAAADDVSPECLARCLADPEMTVENARAAFLQDIRAARSAASRPVGGDAPPAGSSGSRSGKPAALDVLTAAVALRMGGEAAVKMLPYMQYDPVLNQLRMRRLTSHISDEQRKLHERAVNEAYEFEQYESAEICENALRAQKDDFSSRHRHDIVTRAISTPAVSTIYTQTMGAVLLANLGELGDSTLGWCKEQDVKNFKPQELHRLEGGRLKKRNRGETARQASFADAMESYRIAEYSNTLIMDRQDLIDDDLNAWMTAMDEYSRGIKDLRPSLVYGFLATNAALLTDSTTLFHADHSNVLTSSALAAATLQNAITLLASSRGIGGLPLNLRNCVLITSETLSFTADQLVGSAEIREAAAANGTTNPLRMRNIATRSDSRLNVGFVNPANDIDVAGAPTTWYLAAAGGAYGIHVGYRTGTNRMPTMGTKVINGAGQYGLAMDVQFDVGVGVQGYQGLVKATA
jgi:hypothetical protein